MLFIEVANGGGSSVSPASLALIVYHYFMSVISIRMNFIGAWMNNNYINQQIKKLKFSEVVLILLIIIVLTNGYKDGGIKLLLTMLSISFLSIIVCKSTNSIRKAFYLQTIIDKSRILKIIYWLIIMVVLFLSVILLGLSKGSHAILDVLSIYMFSFGITIINFGIKVMQQKV